MSGEPVEVAITAACSYRAKPCALCGKPKSSRAHTPKKTAECPFKRQVGCLRCGRAKSHRDHLGSPPALRDLGSGHQGAYQGLKKTWQAALTDVLREAGLEPAERFVVEGEATFPDAARRDQGNYRVLLEKALGDALVEGGWLVDDDWSRYEFGGLAYRHEPGVSRTRLILMPARVEVAPDADLRYNL